MKKATKQQRFGVFQQKTKAKDKKNVFVQSSSRSEWKQRTLVEKFFSKAMQCSLLFPQNFCCILVSCSESLHEKNIFKLRWLKVVPGKLKTFKIAYAMGPTYVSGTSVSFFSAETSV